MIVSYYDSDDLDKLISQGHWSEEMSPQWKHMRALEHDIEIEEDEDEDDKEGE